MCAVPRECEFSRDLPRSWCGAPLQTALFLKAKGNAAVSLLAQQVFRPVYSCFKRRTTSRSFPGCFLSGRPWSFSSETPFHRPSDRESVSLCGCFYVYQQLSSFSFGRHLCKLFTQRHVSRFPRLRHTSPVLHSPSRRFFYVRKLT